MPTLQENLEKLQTAATNVLKSDEVVAAENTATKAINGAVEEGKDLLDKAVGAVNDFANAPETRAAIAAAATFIQSPETQQAVADVKAGAVNAAKKLVGFFARKSN